MENKGDREELLTPGEVAQLFRVDPKTVTRWAKSGKLTAIRTLGAITAAKFTGCCPRPDAGGLVRLGITRLATAGFDSTQ